MFTLVVTGFWPGGSLARLRSPRPNLSGLGGRGRWAVAIGVVGLAVVLSVAGYSVSGSAPAPARSVAPRVSIASDRSGVAYWTGQVQADSQLIVTRDLQIQTDEATLPPCAQTPAVDPPCRGFAAATAVAMAPMIVADGQAVQDAQTQLTDAQVWLHAFQAKLAHDRTVH